MATPILASSLASKARLGFLGEDDAGRITKGGLRVPPADVFAKLQVQGVLCICGPDGVPRNTAPGNGMGHALSSVAAASESWQISWQPPKLPGWWNLCNSGRLWAKAKACRWVRSVRLQLGWVFAGSQDCPRVGLVGVAPEGGQLQALLVGRQDGNPKYGTRGNMARAEPQVGFLSSSVVVRLARGPDPDSRRVPGDEDRPICPVRHNKEQVEASGEVIPLLSEQLDDKDAYSLGVYQSQSLRHNLLYCVRQEVPPAAGVQKNSNAGASGGLHV